MSPSVNTTVPVTFPTKAVVAVTAENAGALLAGAMVTSTVRVSDAPRRP